MKTGLVSVTFRKLAPLEIIRLCKEAGLDGIEWGSDVHAKDVECAKAIREMMEEACLETFSLGSYYSLGKGQDFHQVVEIAKALRAPNIRIWAGDKERSEIDEDRLEKLASEARMAADEAAKAGMTLSFEYHTHSLTSEQESAMELWNKIGRDNVYLYWQPLEHIPMEKQMADLEELNEKKILKNIHVYYWKRLERFPLTEAKDLWKQYLTRGNSASAALLEFVKEDDPVQFLEDAKVLKEINMMISERAGANLS